MGLRGREISIETYWPFAPFEAEDDGRLCLLPAPAQFRDREDTPLPPPLQFQGVEIPEPHHLLPPPCQFRDDVPGLCNELDKRWLESSTEMSGSSSDESSADGSDVSSDELCPSSFDRVTGMRSCQRAQRVRRPPCRFGDWQF